ncbi:hypothetical protein [Halomonas sp.]|uniref:hypothetical protein n=1 Tax=Halomonas sp. TaxID=1486246 RepID=UPI0025808739|nr:hypothetical protein [Halomonas sp.]MCJ8284119.1 hypothetical protein [Halomonas sp.]NQY69172.1 hypothetical protein [Halomonas sp.]
MWVDLSLIGNHKGQIEPFRSAEEELASLDLVFKGLTVDIQWEHVHIRISQSGEQIVESPRNNPVSGWKAANGKKVNVEISVPQGDGERLTVELFSGEGLEKGLLVSKAYEGEAEGYLSERSEEKGTGVQSKSIDQKDGFNLVRLVLVYHENLVPDLISLSIRYSAGSSNGNSGNGNFVVRW